MRREQAKLLLCAALASVQASAQYDCRRYPLAFPQPSSVQNTEVKQNYGANVFRFRSSSDGTVGTGFLIDPAHGYLLTAYHVINGAGKTTEWSLEAVPGKKFKFSVVADLCKCGPNCASVFAEGRCLAGSGYTGIDAAFLEMDHNDLQVYLSATAGTLNGFDVLLGSLPPNYVYSMGYPTESNSNPAAAPFLDPLATSISSPRITYADDNQTSDPLSLWYLDGAVTIGRSGSPLLDSKGRVFALLVDEGANTNKGIAINLGDIFDRLEASQQPIDPFRSTPLRQPATLLQQKIKANNFSDEADIARALSWTIVSNYELTAVILSVPAELSRFRFVACLAGAVQQRDLAELFHMLYPVPDLAPPKVLAEYHLNNAQRLRATGHPEKASVEFASAYQAAKKDPQPDTALESKAALGEAEALIASNDPSSLKAAETYATIGRTAAYAASDTKLAALASTYLFQIARLNGAPDSDAVRHAQDAFVQAPTPVYKSLYSPQDKAGMFKNYKTLSADDWAPYVGVIQRNLEPKAFGGASSAPATGPKITTEKRQP